jgi:hypothetical protein
MPPNPSDTWREKIPLDWNPTNDPDVKKKEAEQKTASEVDHCRRRSKKQS